MFSFAAKRPGLCRWKAGKAARRGPSWLSPVDMRQSQMSMAQGHPQGNNELWLGPEVCGMAVGAESDPGGREAGAPRDLTA